MIRGSTLAAAPILFMVALAAGCASDSDDNGGPDVDVSDTASDVASDPVGDADATDDDADTTDAATDADGSTTPYRYIMVVDRETEPGAGMTGGVDIVAVELIAGGTSYFADQLHDCRFGDMDNSGANDCNNALGAPAGGIGECQGAGPEDADYVSLGGQPGSLVVSVDGERTLQTGDEIQVYECGREQNPGALDENYDVLIGVSTDPDDPDWIQCIAAGTGITSCVVPTLPDL